MRESIGCGEKGQLRWQKIASPEDGIRCFLFDQIEQSGISVCVAVKIADKKASHERFLQFLMKDVQCTGEWFECSFHDAKGVGDGDAVIGDWHTGPAALQDSGQ